MKAQNAHARSRLRRLTGVATALAALAIPLSACSDIMDVKDLDVITPGQLNDQTAIPAIHASAIASMRDAIAGYDGQILYSGLLGDEFVAAGTYPTRREVDIRTMNIDNSSLATVTRNLYRARTAAEGATERLTALGADADLIGETQALAGYSYIVFAENYCSGIPFSELTAADTIAGGSPKSTSQVLQMAVARFDSVLNNSAVADNDVINLARVGKARALLDLGHYGEAAAVAAQVPDGFIYLLEHSANSSAEYSGVYAMTWDEGRMSAWSSEGGSGLPYLATLDPRTAALKLPARYSFSGDVALNLPLIYQDRTEAVVLSSGVEAQLILAENALKHGDYPGMLDILNSLRANALDYLAERQPTYSVILDDGGYPSTLPAIDSIPSTPDSATAARNLLFRERGFWLYLSSHRLGDMRRLLRQYGLPENQVYPSGAYAGRNGGMYGSDVSLRLDVDEENNPNYDSVSQCVSTAAGEESIPTVLGPANP